MRVTQTQKGLVRGVENESGKGISKMFLEEAEHTKMVRTGTERDTNPYALSK
jgi:hypothetical protein